MKQADSLIDANISCPVLWPGVTSRCTRWQASSKSIRGRARGIAVCHALERLAVSPVAELETGTVSRELKTRERVRLSNWHLLRYRLMRRLGESWEKQVLIPEQSSARSLFSSSLSPRVLLSLAYRSGLCSNFVHTLTHFHIHTLGTEKRIPWLVRL